jgi:large subunit ribosomal protein L17
MRHRMKRHQFSRRSAWHTATVKSMVRSLFVHESIKTTLTRAKAAQPLVEKLISWGKANTLEKKRLAFAVLGGHDLVNLLFANVAPRFKDRTSGFTRILRLENRRGDDAQMVLFQFTQLAEKVKKDKSKKGAKEQGARERSEHSEDVSEKPQADKKHAGEPTAAEKEATRESAPPKKTAKPAKKFLGGIRGIFKKERDSL